MNEYFLSLGFYIITAYCCVGIGGGFCGQTASGAQVGPGTIAADPRLLPFGTRLFIPGYGDGIVQDTGGAIRGQRLDVFYPDCSDAWQWGRRLVPVYLREEE